MHERSKLAEARHFLDRMHAERGSLRAFARELSAFLASTRSVLQYALAEAKSKPGGQRWYDAAATDPLDQFFKGKRDESIHVMPVTPERKFTTEPAGLLNIGDDDDEMLIPYPHTRVVERYEFRERPGDDALDLARRYLSVLEALVEDGVASGWITG